MSMTEAGRQAENVWPPFASTTPGTGVTAIATTTADLVVDLWDSNGNPYSGFYNRYVSIVSCGADCYWTLSDATTPTISEAVTGTTVAAGTTKAVPDILKDGVPQAFRIDDSSIRYLHLKAATGTPIVRLRPSSQPRPR